MRRIVVVVLAGAIAAAFVVPAPPARAGGGLPRRCAAANRAPESGEARRGATPVLFVHGFGGGPSAFRALRDGRSSMLGTIGGLRGVATYTFDYSPYAFSWVTDPNIGPALARSIACLAGVAGRKVVVVAHSMGGLATQLAQGQIIDGRPVSTSLARVVTIGTPARGVILLSFTSGDVANTLVQAAVDTASEACGDDTKKKRRLCELLDVADAPAVASMAPGSAELKALPRWSPSVIVSPIAADLRLRISVLGVGTTVSLGDIVSTVDSATADASKGQRQMVVGCRAELTDLLEVVDESPCSHANELTNRRIIAAVKEQVKRAVDAEDVTAT
jgi:pimeloyl-ACP methyl ester carboxylesterase